MRTIIMMQIFWKLDWQYFMLNKIMMQIFDDLQDYDGNSLVVVTKSIHNWNIW